jgi:hypothetical protein
MVDSLCTSKTDPKWWSEVNLLDPHLDLVILGFQGCSIGRPNGILLKPWFELVFLGPFASCCSLDVHI